MKKIISLLTASVMLMGIYSLPAYAESEYPTKETVTVNTFDELRDHFISSDAELSDGKVFYPDDYKIDFIEGKESVTIIVYGLESVSDISDIKSEAKINGNNLSSIPEYHSGMDAGYSNDYYVFRYNDISRFTVLFFVNNTLTDWLQNDISPLEAASRYNFDVIPYVYPELISGDADCDGMITASDASTVLSAYSTLSTGKELILNSTIFDYNNDGIVNAGDASDILTRYSEISTTTN